MFTKRILTRALLAFTVAVVSVAPAMAQGFVGGFGPPQPVFGLNVNGPNANVGLRVNPNTGRFDLGIRNNNTGGVFRLRIGN